MLKNHNIKVKVLWGVVLLLVLPAAVFSVKAEDSIIDNSRELFENIQLFADSITLISTDYVEPVKIKELVYGAIRGMMDTLDGYSQFLDQDSFRDITEETKGEFGGIGIEIGMKDGVPTVIAPIEDTPAYAAGIITGDKIVRIFDDITQEMTLDDVVEKLRGEPGTDVNITIVRGAEEEVLVFDLKRAVIKLKSIKERLVLPGGTGYVKLLEFQERTGKDLSVAVKELVDVGADSLILDLRNNPGGLLEASVASADLFLEQGELIVYTEGRNPEKRMEFRSKGKPSFADMDIVVLVDGGSASAAEILAGALKDNKRALVVGEPTFGKGSVQTIIPLKDQSALKLTTAAYYTPSGNNLMDKGIEPDILVKRIVLPGKKGDEEKAPDTGKVIYDKVKDKVVDNIPGKQKRNKAGVLLKSGKKDVIEKDNIVPVSESAKAEDNIAEKLLEGDNQLQAAMNILAGARILKEYSVSPEMMSAASSTDARIDKN